MKLKNLFIASILAIIAASCNAEAALNLRALIRSAENGDAAASFALAKYYSSAPDNAVNRTNAARYARMGAEGGNTDAMALLGNMYALGRLVDSDNTQAVKWLSKAAVGGNNDGQYGLCFFYTFLTTDIRDLEAALPWCILAAQRNQPEALSLLGHHYTYGTFGVEANSVMAKEFYEKAISLGNADAAAELGIQYFYGYNGFDKDAPRGIELLVAASNAGSAIGKSYLGEVYLNSEGGNNSVVPRDFQKAKALFLESARLGSCYGFYRLADMYKDGIGVPKNISISYALIASAPVNLMERQPRRFAKLSLEILREKMTDEQLIDAENIAIRLASSRNLERSLRDVEKAIGR